MITGYNTDIKHNDRVFHVQTEDKGVDNPVIESLVYMGGKIVASRQYSYAPLLREGYTEKAVQEMLDSQHRKMVRDINGGKYDPEGPPPFGAGIISERTFDEVVLEFVKAQAQSESLELVLAAGGPFRAGDMVVLDLAVRGEVLNRPVAGAQVEVKAAAPKGGRTVSLFMGVTGDTGMVRAGVDVPEEFAGGTLTVSAQAGSGADEMVLEIDAS
ncbi:MAG TPA: hypothetical protein VGK94_10915 [Candidatus Polarisedimenticolia bacterium]